METTEEHFLAEKKEYWISLWCWVVIAPKIENKMNSLFMILPVIPNE